MKKLSSKGEIVVLLVILCLFTVLLIRQNKCYHREKDPEIIAMRGLVDRVVPQYSKHIVLERLNDTIDCFEIESDGRYLVIRGNNANSMAVGLNHYLNITVRHNILGLRPKNSRYL